MRGAPSQRRPAWSRCLQTTRGQINSLLLICARPQLCCLGSGHYHRRKASDFHVARLVLSADAEARRVRQVGGVRPRDTPTGD
jgi:hypothetical protein